MAETPQRFAYISHRSENALLTGIGLYSWIEGSLSTDKSLVEPGLHQKNTTTVEASVRTTRLGPPTARVATTCVSTGEPACYEASPLNCELPISFKGLNTELRARVRIHSAWPLCLYYFAARFELRQLSKKSNSAIPITDPPSTHNIDKTM